MTSLKYALILMLPLGLTTPAFAQNVVVTTDKGGTMTKDRDCIRGNGAANCQATSTATTAGGQSVSKDRLRTTDAGGTTTSVTNTGPNGQTAGKTRKVTR